MADNVTLPATGSGSATPVVRTKDRAAVETQIVALDLNPAGAETLMAGNVPVTGNVASGAADSGNPVKAGGVFNTTPALLSAGQRGDLQLTSRQEVLVALSQGTNQAVITAPADGASNASGGVIALARLTAYNGVTWDRVAITSAGAIKVDGSGTALPVSGSVTPIGGTTQGATAGRLASSAATTNATSLKASAGTVYGVSLMNTNAAVRYLHLYDKATAPTVGTDTPIATIPVPVSNGAIVRPFVTGLKFTTGIAYAMTTDAAATNLAVAAGDLVGLLIDYS